MKINKRNSLLCIAVFLILLMSLTGCQKKHNTVKELKSAEFGLITEYTDEGLDYYIKDSEVSKLKNELKKISISKEKIDIKKDDKINTELFKYNIKFYNKDSNKISELFINEEGKAYNEDGYLVKGDEFYNWLESIKNNAANFIKNAQEQSNSKETGLFYGAPNSYDEIESISVVYEANKNIDIDLKQKNVNYEEYDSNGNIAKSKENISLDMFPAFTESYIMSSEVMNRLNSISPENNPIYAIEITCKGKKASYSSSVKDSFFEDLLGRLRVNDGIFN